MKKNFLTLSKFSIRGQQSYQYRIAFRSARLQFIPFDFHIAAVSYQWYKDDKQFVRPDLHSYIFISRNGKLYFSEVSTADRGNYRCIVKLTSNNGAAIGTDQPPSRTSLPTLLDVQNSGKRLITLHGIFNRNEFSSYRIYTRINWSRQFTLYKPRKRTKSPCQSCKIYLQLSNVLK